MNGNKPWYKSSTLQAQVAQIIVAALAMFGVANEIDWSATVQALFAGIAAAMAIWTVFSRLFNANEPITDVAKTAVKVAELKKKS